MKKLSVKNITFIALFAAIVAVLSQVAIPLPSGVPVTLQTLAVALCGYTLGAKKGVAATALYILIGAVGIPVFSGFKGGAGILFNMTGGFIWGFLLLTLLCGFGSHNSSRIIGLLLGCAGLIACHLLGVVQFAIINSTSFFKSIMLVSVPYLIKDVLSVAIAYYAAAAVKLSLKKAKIS